METVQLLEAAVYDAPAQRGAGLAIAAGFLWQADYQAKELLCMDLESLEIVGRMPSHGTPAGLAWDGQLLWQSVFGAGVALGLDI